MKEIYISGITMLIAGLLIGYGIAYKNITPIEGIKLDEVCDLHELDDLCADEFIKFCELYAYEIIPERYAGYNQLPEWFCEDHDCYYEDDESGLLHCHYYLDLNIK